MKLLGYRKAVVCIITLIVCGVCGHTMEASKYSTFMLYTSIIISAFFTNNTMGKFKRSKENENRN